MLGLGIACFAAPLATWQGLKARLLPDARRGGAVAGLIFGLFAMIVPGSQVAQSAAALAKGEPPPPETIACDCASVTPGATFEIALVASGAEGSQATKVGSGDHLALQRDAVASLADVESLSALRDDAGRIMLLVTLRPDAASRVEHLPMGTRIVIVVGGRHVHDSAIVAPLRGTLMFHLPITEDEACALQCAADGH